MEAVTGQNMRLAAIASSATTLAAFFPFLFWDSLVGKFMSYLPITLIFVLVASLVMALIFLLGWPLEWVYLGEFLLLEQSAQEAASAAARRTEDEFILGFLDFLAAVLWLAGAR